MSPIIVWFRQDLRLCDNPALIHAVQSGKPVICVHVLDDETPGAWKWGGASRWWLHHSLSVLDEALSKLGGGLVLRRGVAGDAIKALVRESGADAVVWNRCYEPFAIAHDKKLKAELTQDGVQVESFNASLLFEPWEITTKDSRPFRVFTPFWNALRARSEAAKPRPAPRKISFHPAMVSEKLADWGLLPSRPYWARGFSWIPGERAAARTLRDFLDQMPGYKVGRDIPSKVATSGLSPYLHWGEISPRQVWHAVRAHRHGGSDGAQTFLKEIAWREFSYQLLFHQPQLPHEPVDRRFAQFPWTGHDADFIAWTRGQTGIPIVDAGMRQLWQTGWMHNRVRMIVASFLIKHLGIDWRRGQAWFWDTLVDADLANNAASWQWVAGSGADAAPFFRIFNPVLQGQKFDPDGMYVRKFVPEIRDVADKFIHRPWDAPEPPPQYPAPIVDLAAGRARALKAFKALKPAQP